MPALAGFGGRLLVGNRIYRANRWNLSWTAEALDVLTFENAGFGSYMSGLRGGEVSFDAYYHTIDNPFAGVEPLYPGNYHTVEIQYVKGDLDYYWLLPNVECLDVTSDAEVRGVVHYTYRGKFSSYDFTFGYGKNYSPSAPFVEDS